MYKLVCQCFILLCVFLSGASITEVIVEQGEVASLWCDIGVTGARLVTTWSWKNGTLIGSYVAGTGFIPTGNGAELEPYMDISGTLFINRTEPEFTDEIFVSDGAAMDTTPGTECSVLLKINGKNMFFFATYHSKFSINSDGCTF